MNFYIRTVRVLSHQFTRERPRCRIIKGVTFFDKTEIDRAEESPNSRKGHSAGEQEDGQSQAWAKLGWRTKEIEQH